MIKQNIDSFPVLPATVSRLMDVTNNPECSVQEIVGTIQADQSLCLTVLKIANSVLFGRPQRVDSLKMAVVILGFNEVQRIAMTKSLINSFGHLARKHKLAIDKFWHHSFVCGMAARIIASDLAFAPDIAFMGGLIHDVGKLIMLQTFEGAYLPEEWMAHFSKEEILNKELERFSFTHDMLGGALLQKWFFPKNLIAAVAYHHRPVGAAKEKSFAHIIQLADLLSFYCCNQELLGDDDIVKMVRIHLPEIDDEWQNLGLSLSAEAIASWFHWLINNHEQGSSLSEAFFA